MKITAIIAEYNPYHNGHNLQKNLIKKPGNSHFCVAVMSGNFVQRGAPAIFNKWARARMALLAGMDIVIELPVAYALQSAEGFAAGGVAIATAIGADELCFGSESADLDALTRAASRLARENPAYRERLKSFLASGHSFPAARTLAMREANAPPEPNDILGVEYIKAIIRQNSQLTPRVIRREGAGYNEPGLSGGISSATAIRNAVAGEDFAGALQSVPPECQNYFDELLNTERPVFPAYFTDMLLYRIRSMPAEELARISGVAEGLENKIKKAAQTSDTLESLIAAVKSKRYTHTRISRILFCALLGITSELVTEANTYSSLYARVLGYRRDALPALSRISEQSRIPVITRGTQLPAGPLSRLDVQASDIYALACKTKTAGRDYTEKIIVV